jgi:hypothetical protein
MRERRMSQSQSHLPAKPAPPEDSSTVLADPGAVVQAAVAQFEVLRIQGENASSSQTNPEDSRLRDLSPFGR